MELNEAQIRELVAQVMSKLNDSEVNIGAAAPAAPCEGLGTGGVEPYNHVYNTVDYGAGSDRSIYARTNRLLKRVHNTPKGVDSERAVLATEAYKKFDGQPTIIKCANTLKYIVENATIRIYPDELIVGEIAAPSNCAPVFPEYSFGWICNEIKNEPWSLRASDKMAATQKTLDDLLSLEEFWKGKTVEEFAGQVLTEEEIKGSAYGGRPVFHPNQYLFFGMGHIGPRFEMLFEKGFGGIRKNIEQCMEKLDKGDPDFGRKMAFLKSQLICNDAAMIYVRRYAELARETARTETDTNRKNELLQIAVNCDSIAVEPPRTFWQALQLMHMATNLVLIESSGQGIAYGRPDKTLYPFYEADMKAGRITKQEVGALIENWYVKLFELHKLRDNVTAILNSEIGMGGTTLIIGGVDDEGRDSTNDLSYLFLEAHAHTQLPDPWFAVRWHKQAPYEYKVKVCSVIRMGTGQPKIFNDDEIIPAMLSVGRPLKSARDYSIIGCVENNTCGESWDCTDTSYFSLAKVLELAMNDGRCTDCKSTCPRYERCGKIGGRLGPATGALASFKSFDEVKRAFEIQMAYWVEKQITFANVIEYTHATHKPTPYMSMVFEGTAEAGLDLTWGGAKYNASGIQGVGVASAADGLAAIKQLMFEEKKCTPEEMLDALKRNWEGHEDLYALVNSDKVHHYGNDDDYADDLALFVSDVYCREVSRYRLQRGNGVYRPGIFSVSANVGIGLVQGASPDGRKDAEPVSNCIGPVNSAVGCHDIMGPTAMAKSAGKLNQLAATNGTLMNVKFTPTCVAGETGLSNFISYVDTYFQNGGMHVQFNIVNNATLKDAQIHPELYPNLLVRVAGYSAYFVRMSKELQDDLIRRNEYSAFD
ncbi:pyruvate formate lyase family protein [Enterocloster citroniae]|uniref:glycyl radical protein n=1 Tax=Enterocloster citroniae TaxID=358743 RepID=UPI0032BFCBCE